MNDEVEFTMIISKIDKTKFHFSELTHFLNFEDTISRIITRGYYYASVGGNVIQSII